MMRAVLAPPRSITTRERPVISWVAIGLVVLHGYAFADPTPWEILDRWRSRDAWTSRRQILTIEVFDGNEQQRRLVIRSDEERGAAGVLRVRGFFESPNDLYGEEFIGVVENGQVRWALYLPWQSRVRLIAPDLGDSVEGTDLTFGDVILLAELPRWREADATASLSQRDLGSDERSFGPRAASDPNAVGASTPDGTSLPVSPTEDPSGMSDALSALASAIGSHGGTPCWVVELTAIRAVCGYDRVDVWIAADEALLRRLEFRARGSEVVKQIDLSDFQDVDTVPMSRHMEISRPQQRTRTVVAVEKATLAVRFRRGHFDSTSLGH